MVLPGNGVPPDGVVDQHIDPSHPGVAGGDELEHGPTAAEVHDGVGF